MADLSQLTDEELEQKRQEILSKKARSMNVEEPRALDLSPISDEELEAAKQGDRAAIEKIKAEIRSPISSAMKPISLRPESFQSKVTPRICIAFSIGFSIVCTLSLKRIEL